MSTSPIKTTAETPTSPTATTTTSTTSSSSPKKESIFSTPNTSFQLTPDTADISTQTELEQIVSQTQTETFEMSSQRIDMPAFEKTNVEAWFLAMDYWFKATDTKDDEHKFNLVIAKQGVLTLPKLKEILDNQPATEKYKYIKEKLISFYAESEQVCLNILLSGMPLGDQKPSELFQEMKRVAGDTVTEKALKGLWSRRLPDHARAAVVASTGTAEEFTRIADAIVEAMQLKTINEVKTETTTATVNEISQLKSQINELTKLFNNKFSERSRSNSRQRGNGNNRGRSTSRNRNQPPDGSTECWYHWKFGNNSRKCRSPCRHKKSKTTNKENTA